MICPQSLPHIDPGPHEWQTNRWSDWEGPGEHPRTCSYCGSVHPEDVIKLIEQGWEIHPSTKSYKWYIELPGTADHQAGFLKAIGNDEYMEAEKANPFKRLSSPMKLYGQHTDKDQQNRLNRLLD